MTDKERFLNEVKEVKLIIQANRAQGAFSEGYLIGQESVLEHFEKFIDSMQEESEDDWKYSIAERLGVSKDEFDKMKPVSDDIEQAAKNCNANLQLQEYFKRGAQWHKQQTMANSADAMIGLPYENKDGGYTHLIDVSRPLPVGNNKIAIIFKED